MTGIVLTAFGKRGYGLAAHNLALSLRNNGCKFPITLYAQRETITGINLALFDSIQYLEEREYTFRNKFAPGYGKINAIAKLPYDENLFIDVDSLCLREIDTLVDKLREKDFSTIWMGEGYKGQNISYDPWAEHNYAWTFFDLPENAKWTTTQTSLVWIRKTEETQRIVRELQYYYEKGYHTIGLKEAWARKYIPDELIFSGVIARKNLNIQLPFDPVFFPVINNPHVGQSFEWVTQHHYFLSMLGGDGRNAIAMPRFQEWYSQLGRNIEQKEGIEFFNHKYVMADKLLTC